MSYLKTIRWFLVAMFTCSPIYADVIIDNQSIPGTDIQSITMSPTSGNIFITTTTGYVVEPASPEPPPAGDAAITTFSASPTTITEGQSVNIIWVSQNTNTCSATGGTGNWAAASVVLSGDKTIVISVAGTHQFTLQCVGDSGPVQRSLTVTVNEPAPITNNCVAPSLGGNIVEWADLWNGTAFPNPVSADEFVAIPRNGYLAVKFDTANFVDTGVLSTIESTSTSGRRLGVISRCPGDFEVEDSKCKHVWGVGGEIFWSTEGFSKACILEPNTTYYFNLTFTDGEDPATSECVNRNCITKIRTFNP